MCTTGCKKPFDMRRDIVDEAHYSLILQQPNEKDDM